MTETALDPRKALEREAKRLLSAINCNVPISTIDLLYQFYSVVKSVSYNHWHDIPDDIKFAVQELEEHFRTKNERH